MSKVEPISRSTSIQPGEVGAGLQVQQCLIILVRDKRIEVVIFTARWLGWTLHSLVLGYAKAHLHPNASMPQFAVSEAFLRRLQNFDVIGKNLHLEAKWIER